MRDLETAKRKQYYVSFEPFLRIVYVLVVVYVYVVIVYVAHISLLKCGINVRVKYLPLNNTLVIIVIRDKIKKLNRESNSIGFSPSFAYKIWSFPRSRCIERLE